MTTPPPMPPHAPHPPPRPPRSQNRTITIIIASAAACIAAIISTGVYLTHRDDPAACKAAMVEQLQDAMATPDAAPKTRPSACEGIDDATLQRLAGEAMSEWLDSDEAAEVFEDRLERP